MRRYFADMNPFVRGLLVVAAIARIAFFLAIAFFVFLMWRERRSEIGSWSTRAQVAFYGAAILAVVALGAYFTVGASGPDALAFLLVLILCAFSMFRIWRDQHSWS
jgi:hypothetical protein